MRAPQLLRPAQSWRPGCSHGEACAHVGSDSGVESLMRSAHSGERYERRKERTRGKPEEERGQSV